MTAAFNLHTGSKTIRITTTGEKLSAHAGQSTFRGFLALRRVRALLDAALPLLHEDGRQEGVRVGYTRVGLKPCLQPLLAVLAEVKLIAQFCLRPGNAHCANILLAFTLELLSNLPSHVRLWLVRADSGFHSDPWLCLRESQGLDYIELARPPSSLVPSAASVVADLSVRVQRVIKKETQWQSATVLGVEVADLTYESRSASRARRLVILRRRLEDEHGGGKGCSIAPATNTRRS